MWSVPDFPIAQEAKSWVAQQLAQSETEATGLPDWVPFADRLEPYRGEIMAKLGEFASALGGFLRESWPGSRKAPWGSIKTVWQDIVATAFTTMAVYSAYPQETKDMTVTTAPTGVAKHIPALSWLRSYQSDWLRLDLVAGLTAAAVVIPQAMAYAAIAGLPVEVGLYKEISCRRSCRCWKG